MLQLVTNKKYSANKKICVTAYDKKGTGGGLHAQYTVYGETFPCFFLI